MAKQHAASFPHPPRSYSSSLARSKKKKKKKKKKAAKLIVTASAALHLQVLSALTRNNIQLILAVASASQVSFNTVSCNAMVIKNSQGPFSCTDYRGHSGPHPYVIHPQQHRKVLA